MSEGRGDNPEAKREGAMLAWIQQYAPYGVFTLDTSLQVQSWNRWLESHSFPAAQVIGRPLFDVFPDLAQRNLTSPFQRALAGETNVLSTALHHYLLPLKVRGGGSETGMMQQTARVAPLLAGNEVCGVIGVIEDVTQREDQAIVLARQHRRDEVLAYALIHLLKAQEPRKTIRTLFFKIAEYLDFDTFFLYLRDAATDKAKLYTAGGVTDELEKQFVNYELLASVADGQDPVVFNVVKNHKEPGYALLQAAKIASAVAIPLRVEGKKLGLLCFGTWNRENIAGEECAFLATIAQYLATAVDKEDTTRELQRVEAVNRWMRAIVESSDDAIISTDLNGIILSCNPGAARLFGGNISDLIGQPVETLAPADRKSQEAEVRRRLQVGQRVESFETVRRRKDGSLVDVSLMISPVLDSDGKVSGFSSIARDATERRAAEKALAESFQREKQAREIAESANRTKDNFLAALSHELRTPLNPALLIASEAADNPALPEMVRLKFDSIRKSIELEASLIDDLLDLTRITAGKMVLNKLPVAVHEVLTDAIAIARPEQQEKKIQLDIKLNAPRSIVDGDAVRLQQVFWNILKNAVKFTPVGGKITLGTAVEEGEQLAVTIADSGIGMTAEELARVFTAFAQGDHAGGGGSHQFGGLGLGLAISRNLVAMHGGTIAAESDGKNLGAVFTIRLPLTYVIKTAVEPRHLVDGKDSKLKSPDMVVLLVEDHEITRNVMAQLLARRNLRVFVADSIAQAREIARENKLDLLISDVGLPDGSGNDLMDEFRQQYGLKGIALTGYGMEDDIDRGKSAGFVTHLIKPVRIQTLENALAIVKAHNNKA